MLERGEIAVVTFASSSSVRYFATALGEERARSLLAKTCVACIGPVTAETAAGLGIGVDAMPEEYTIEALVEAIVAQFAG
jgi:uroporphyrinogen-III synthase